MSAFLATRRDPIKMLDLLSFEKIEKADRLQTSLPGAIEKAGRAIKPRPPIPSIIVERIVRKARRGRGGEARDHQSH